MFKKNWRDYVNNLDIKLEFDQFWLKNFYHGASFNRLTLQSFYKKKMKNVKKKNLRILWNNMFMP